MYYQLGFGRILEQRLLHWGINLRTQPKLNRELAYQGSISGEYSTIDLSSASDSLSVGVLRQILPPQFMRWLMLLRTPSVELPSGDKLRLNMISTMGNGFTFPLETTIFSAVVRAVIKVSGDKPTAGTWSVFGDDIILRTKYTPDCLRLLDLLGFTVNSSKTFVEGPFRESCGRDYYRGVDVRGVYIKSLKSPQDRYVAINKLNDWTATTGISLPSAVQYLLKSVKRALVSPFEGLDAGIQVPISCLTKAYAGLTVVSITP